MSDQELQNFKDGTFDALVHGQRDEDKNSSHYTRGYDFGLGIVNELNILGACFLEGDTKWKHLTK